jgi:hypothetical protein
MAGTRIDRRLGRLGLLLLTAGAVCCTTISDPNLVLEIGNGRAVTADSDLGTQTIEPYDEPIQVAEWEVSVATMDLDGTLLDMTAGEPCDTVQTVFTFPISTSKCAGGIVIDANPVDPVPIILALTFTMQVRRAEPIPLPPGGDYDGDGLLNAVDICPLVPNPDQEDDDQDGIGDACSTRDPLGGGNALDSDADGVADDFDNCIWVPNPLQEDTEGVGAEGIPDGIGDACEEQIAVVESGGSSTMQVLLGPIDLLQPLGGISYITADYVDQYSLTCDWDAGFCQLDLNQIEFCVIGSLVGTTLGCSGT